MSCSHLHPLTGEGERGPVPPLLLAWGHAGSMLRAQAMSCGSLAPGAVLWAYSQQDKVGVDTL
jgi:hypothetical protein